MPQAKADAVWNGDLRSGTGRFNAGNGIQADYSFKTRFEGAPGANPEQLLGAAHAACFSMALSNMLAEAGSPPRSVRTEATVALQTVEGKPTISSIHLVTRGNVPGLDEREFVRLAGEAKTGCPVSRALASVPEITLDAALED